MEKNNKSERFEMRTSPSLKALMQKLADNKKMKVPELVTYLVRREADNEKVTID